MSASAPVGVSAPEGDAARLLPLAILLRNTQATPTERRRLILAYAALQLRRSRPQTPSSSTAALASVTPDPASPANRP